MVQVSNRRPINPQMTNLIFCYFCFFALKHVSCIEFAGPDSASLHLGNTATFEEMLQQWQSVSNTVSGLTGPRFEPQTFRSRQTHYRSTSCLVLKLLLCYVSIVCNNYCVIQWFSTFSPPCITSCRTYAIHCLQHQI